MNESMMRRIILFGAGAAVSATLSMYAFAAVPETPAKAPEVAGAAQSQVTTRDLLENIGLQVLINQLNEFRTKIVCPVGQTACDLRVHVENGQMTSVLPDGGAPAKPMIPQPPMHPTPPSVPSHPPFQSMPNHAPVPNSNPTAPHHP